jgi:Skp family chaperone for outer membrane proteins
MLEDDRRQYDSEIANAEKELANQEQRLQDAIRSGVSPEGIRSFERSVSEYRSRLSLAQSRKASDYYNMNSD